MTRATESHPQNGTLAWRAIARNAQRDMLRDTRHRVAREVGVPAWHTFCACRGCRWERWTHSRVGLWLGWSLVALAVIGWGWMVAGLFR